MIDEKILDEILPVPDLEDLREEKIAELKGDDFVVTNFTSGGIFHTLLMIALRIYIEIVTLARSILNQMSVTHATGAWLDLKASDYSKIRKEATKTRGYVTISRPSGGEAVKIPKGHLFKTQRDINGEELRFVVLEAAVLPKDGLSVAVEVEAEKAGSRYNVPADQITRTLIHLGGGVDTITNAEDWLTYEGADLEDDESLRARTLRAWSERARVPIRDTYRNICEAIPGVLYVNVDDHHPRGQGTIDIIVTSTAGAASDALLDDCREACAAVKAPDDNLLVKSSEVVIQDIALAVTFPASSSQEGLAERVRASITDMMQIRKDRALNELIHADIIYHVKADVPAVKNVTVTTPPADTILESGKVILPGSISVITEGV